MRTTTAVVYLCTSDGHIARTMMIDWCMQRAAACGLSISHIAIDDDDLAPVEDRSGWRQIMALAASDSVSAVVTMSSAMVAPDARSWRRMGAWLQELGVRLITPQTPLDTPTARSAAPAVTR